MRLTVAVGCFALFAAGVLVAEAACPTVSFNGHSVDFSNLRPSDISATLLKDGTSTNIQWGVDLCGSKPPTPGTTPCATPGYLEVYDQTALCLDSFPTAPSTWFWDVNRSAAIGIYTSAGGSKVTVSLTCGTSKSLVTVGDSDVNTTATVSSYSVTFSSQIVCAVTPAPTTPAPPATPAPTPAPVDIYTYWFHNKVTGAFETKPPGTNITAIVEQNADLESAAKSFSDLTGMQRVGWDTLYIEADRKFLSMNGMKSYYLAGYIEGRETQHRIYQNYVNLYPPSWNLTTQVNQRVMDWITHQWNWYNATSLALMQVADGNQSYWTSVQGSVQQMQGMLDGYHAVAGPESPEYLSDFAIYMVGFNFELSDVQFWDNATRNASSSSSSESGDAKQRYPAKPHRASHCSAFVKDTGHDLFMAQDTWSDYNTMLRQYKTYFLETQVSFTSYPGTLHSGDDWYMMSTGLTSQETTIGYYATESNPAEKIAAKIYNESVPEFIRVMVANRLASTVQEWTSLFCNNNSGTYNNEYMIVNMNNFVPNATTPLARIPDGTFMVVDQIPGYCASEDASNILRNQTYFASYNIPAIPLIFEASGASDMVEEYGDWFSYEKTPRAQIFARNQTTVKTIGDVMALMRYNDFMHDPLSRIQNCSTCPNQTCVPGYSPNLAIAARADLAASNLNDTTAGPLWWAFTRSAFGAIDAKIASWSGHKNLSATIISGPTVLPQYGIPPFDWETSGFASIEHEGIPAQFDFAATNTTSLLAPPPVTQAPLSTEAPLATTRAPFVTQAPLATTRAPLATQAPLEPESEMSKLWILGVIAGVVVLVVVFALMLIYKRRRFTVDEGEAKYSPLDERKV